MHLAVDLAKRSFKVCGTDRGCASFQPRSSQALLQQLFNNQPPAPSAPEATQAALPSASWCASAAGRVRSARMIRVSGTLLLVRMISIEITEGTSLVCAVRAIVPAERRAAVDEVIRQASADAVVECQCLPPGPLYEECYARVASEIIIGNQIAHERSEFLVIFGLVATIGLAAAALSKRLSGEH